MNVSDGVYRVADATETGESAIIEAGKVTVNGLDAGTYYLEETEAPSGYNKLASRVSVTITNANLTTTFTGTNDAAWADADGGVQVTNNSGTELPSTGGMGTTLFYIVGSALVIGALILLVVKKRMNGRTK